MFLSLIAGGVLVTAAVAGVQPGQSGGPEPLTLEAAIEWATAHNPGLRASASRVDAAAGRNEQARRWRNPELVFETEEVPVSRGSFRDSKNTLGLEQTLPFPGKKKLEGAIGTAGVRVSQAERAQTERELVRRVKVAFYSVLTAERLVGVAEELAGVAGSVAATARKRVEAGAAADQEQLRAEIQLDQARADLAASRQEAALAREELALALGLPELEAPLAGTLSETPDLALAGLDPADWLAGHPGVAAARSARAQAELAVRRARLEPYPDVTVGVAGGREGRDDNALVEFGVSLPLPLFDRSKGRTREARANLAVAEAELAVVEQRLRRDWNVAGKRFRTAAAQAAAYRERILPKANEALRLVQTGFEAGKFGLIDLLDTQRMTAEARRAYQEKLLELNSAEADLEALASDVRRPPQASAAVANPVPPAPPVSTQPNEMP